MDLHARLATLGAVLALGIAPAIAVAAGPPAGTPPHNEGTAHKPDTPGPHASLPAKAKAYGVYCRGESKRHVAGQRGTPFSKCVMAMAKLAAGATHNPRTA